MNLNERIREIRVENRLTAKQFGNIFNVSESAVSLYESGKRTPNKDLILKMAYYFNVSTDYLLGKSDFTCLELQCLVSVDKFDIAIELKKILMQIKKNENIIFNDMILDEEIKLLLIKMLEVAFETGDIMSSTFKADSFT